MKDHPRPKRTLRLPGALATILFWCWATIVVLGVGCVTASAESAQDSNPSAPAPSAVSSPAPAATRSDWVRSVEVGGGYGKYTKGLGQSDGQSLRFGISRPWHYGWIFDVGREHRFGETSIGYGATFNQTLPHRANLTFGIGSGTGKILAPRYRASVTASGSVLGLVASAGYLRTQSKAENRSDGFSLGLLRYQGHWIIGASGRQDYGYPGRTISRSWGGGLTYYQWRKLYIGAGFDRGDVSYMLIKPDRAEVNFNSTAYNLGGSYWFTDKSGLNLRLSHGRTSFYTVNGVTVSLFQEW
jgi:YaiO family outer membrane protein